MYVFLLTKTISIGNGQEYGEIHTAILSHINIKKSSDNYYEIKRNTQFES
jgi:hypothetical protein